MFQRKFSFHWQEKYYILLAVISSCSKRLKLQPKTYRGEKDVSYKFLQFSNLFQKTQKCFYSYFHSGPHRHHSVASLSTTRAVLRQAERASAASQGQRPGRALPPSCDSLASPEFFKSPKMPADSIKMPHKLLCAFTFIIFWISQKAKKSNKVLQKTSCGKTYILETISHGQPGLKTSVTRQPGLRGEILSGWGGGTKKTTNKTKHYNLNTLLQF